MIVITYTGGPHVAVNNPGYLWAWFFKGPTDAQVWIVPGTITEWADDQA
jgi:hypothetical protein